MLLRKLFRTAWSYKSQFISMVIMIAIGFGIFLGFNIEWKSLEQGAFTFLEDTNYADFRIYSESGFTEDDIKAIQNIDGVDAATRYFNVNVGIKNTKKSLALNVSENYSVSTMKVMEGAEYDENSDGIWLSDKFAEANDMEIGDELTITYVGIELYKDYVGVKMLPTSELKNYQQSKYKTVEQKAQNRNLFVAWVAVFISVLSILVGNIIPMFQPSEIDSLNEISEQLYSIEQSLDSMDEDDTIYLELQEIEQALDQITSKIDNNNSSQEIKTLIEDLLEWLDEIKSNMPSN